MRDDHRRGHPWGRAHMGLVKQLGCAACRQERGYSTGPSHAHHINCRGMGMKASDFETIPLCDLHHDGGIPGVSVHAGVRVWRFDERLLLELTWARLQLLGRVPEGLEVGEPYAPVPTTGPQKAIPSGW